MPTLDELQRVSAQQMNRQQAGFTLNELRAMTSAADMGQTWVREDIGEGTVDVSNYMQRASDRIQRYQQARSDKGQDRLTANEQVAIVDAYRQTAGMQPEGYYLTREGAAVPKDQFAELQRKKTEDSDWENFKSNISGTVLQNLNGIRANQAKITDALGITDNALTAAMRDSEEVNRILQPRGGKSGFTGQLVGNVMNLYLGGFKSAPGRFAASTAGSTFIDVAHRRTEGQEISATAEWTAAISNAAIEYALEMFGQKIAMKAGARLSGSVGSLTKAISGQGIRGGIRAAAGVVTKFGVEQGGLAAQGFAEESITELLQNTVRRVAYAPEQAITEGIWQAGLQGAFMPIVASPGTAAMQRWGGGTSGLVPDASSPAAGDQTLANNVRPPDEITPKQMSVDEVIKYVGTTEGPSDVLRGMIGKGPFIQVDIPIESIDPGILLPTDTDQNKLTRAKQAITAGKIPPPIVAAQKGDQLYIADGTHRVLAAKEAGLTTIPALVPLDYAKAEGLLPTPAEQIGVEKALQSENTLPDSLKPSLPAEADIPSAGDNSTVGEVDLVDKWIGDRQLAETKADIDARNHRRDLKGLIREGEQLDIVDAAMAVYIDMKENSDSYTAENILGLTPAQQTIVEQAQSLSPEQQAFADQIIAENKALGIEAMDAGIIKNFQENYSARFWKKGSFPGRKIGKFTITTPRQRQRTLPSLIEGWAEGLELEVPGVVEAQMLARQQIAQVIHDRNLVTLGLKSGVFNKVRTDTHTHRVKHPNFAKWVWSGEVEKGEVIDPITGESREAKRKLYGKDAFLAPDGNIYRRTNMYTDKQTAKFLNNALGSSVMYNWKGIGTITKYNSIVKHMILTAALFHHQAYLRSFMLASRGINPVKAYREGREAIENFTPEVQELVHEGLTIGKILDFDPAVQRESTVIGEAIDKVPMASGIRKALRKLSKANTNFLFGKFGPYLKTQAALLEYRSQLKKNNQRILDGKITRKEIAKNVSDMVNDDFGGLNLQRMGRNPTQQHIFQLLALAPDWTESNIRTMAKAFKRGHEGKVYRAMWGRVLAKGVGTTILFNILMSSLDDEDTFFERYEKAWKSGNLRWLDVDITPAYRKFGGEKGKRKYFSLVGHFKDPVKFLRYPIRSAKNKSSVIGRITLDSLTGTDWRGREFTTYGDLIRNGDTVKSVPFGGGPINPEQFPSFIIKQAEQSTPIQAQSLIQWLRGEMDGFDALTRGAGILTSTTYPQKQRKRKKVKKQQRKKQ